MLSAIRYGRMPEAERKKLVAGLLAEEQSVGKPGGSDLKTLAKQVNTAYLKNLSMTKKRARSILTGKTSSTSVRVLCRLHKPTFISICRHLRGMHDRQRLMMAVLAKQLDRLGFTADM